MGNELGELRELKQQIDDKIKEVGTDYVIYNPLDFISEFMYKETTIVEYFAAAYLEEQVAIIKSLLKSEFKEPLEYVVVALLNCIVIEYKEELAEILEEVPEILTDSLRDNIEKNVIIKTMSARMKPSAIFSIKATATGLIVSIVLLIASVITKEPMVLALTSIVTIPTFIIMMLSISTVVSYTEALKIEQSEHKEK